MEEEEEEFPEFIPFLKGNIEQRERERNEVKYKNPAEKKIIHWNH